MRLVLLDRSGHPTFAAPRLQHALDTLVPPTSMIGEKGSEANIR